MFKKINGSPNIFHILQFQESNHLDLLKKSSMRDNKFRDTLIKYNMIPSKPFIFKIDLGITGRITPTFELRMKGKGRIFINWGDDEMSYISLENKNEKIVHHYPSLDRYTIEIKGIDATQVTFGCLDLYNHYKEKFSPIIEIVQWGDSIDFISLSGAFCNTKDGLRLPDFIPSEVTDLSGIFKYSKIKKVESIEKWDLKNVKNISDMFHGAKNFNQDLSGWDVSSVEDFSRTFYEAEKFHGDISGWNVSSAKNMESMFFKAKNFNSDIGNWNVSSVENMSFMFYNTEKFNADISGWDVSSVVLMNFMLCKAKLFQRDIRNWNPRNLRRKKSILLGATNFRYSLNNWNDKMIRKIN